MQTDERPQVGQEGGVRLRWDESGAVSLHPTVVQVKASRQEVMLLFGRPLHSEDDEVHAGLDERIVVSPFLAKRLLVLLNNVIGQYESAYGSLDGPSLPEAGERKGNLLGLPPFRFRLTTERVTSFFELIRDLKVPVGFERSFKISPRALMGGRFLVGIKKNAVGWDPEEKMLRLCEKMEMPPNLLRDFRENLGRARVVGFGFGENETACIAKAYLEFGNQNNGRFGSEGDDVQPYLSHLGFKWDARDNSRNLVARYCSFPLLPTGEVQRRIRKGFSACSPEMFENIDDIVQLASGKEASDTFPYMEVTEGSGSRSSFDINLYRANLLMGDLRPLFQKMCGLYSIPANEFETLYEPVRNQVLGHLAGGVDRSGKDFLTVYFSG